MFKYNFFRLLFYQFLLMVDVEYVKYLVIFLYFGSVNSVSMA